MRRTPAPRRAVLLLAGAPLLLGVSACSEEEQQGSAQATESPAGSTSSEPTASEPSADAAPEGEVVDNEEFVGDMRAGLEKSTTARMRMTSDAGGIDAEGVVDYTTAPVSMAMTMSSAAMGGQQSDLRLVDGIMYMNLGAMSNDRFIAFDLSDPGGLPPGLEGIGDQMDPLASVDQLAAAIETVTFVGTEDVDGEELGHYHVVADTSRLESFDSIPAGSGVPPEVEYDLWFDGDFRMRRMEMTMDMEQPVSVDVELFDWGTPVDIEAPPEDQVVEQPPPR